MIIFNNYNYNRKNISLELIQTYKSSSSLLPFLDDKLFQIFNLCERCSFFHNCARFTFYTVLLWENLSKKKEYPFLVILKGKRYSLHNNINNITLLDKFRNFLIFIDYILFFILFFKKFFIFINGFSIH